MELLVNTEKLIELRGTGDDPWTPGEFNAVLRYMLSTAGEIPVTQVEIMESIGRLAGRAEKAEAQMAALTEALQEAISDVHGEYCSTPYDVCQRCAKAREALRSVKEDA